MLAGELLGARTKLEKLTVFEWRTVFKAGSTVRFEITVRYESF